MRGVYLSQDLSHAGGIEKKSINKSKNLKRTILLYIRRLIPREIYFT